MVVSMLWFGTLGCTKGDSLAAPFASKQSSVACTSVSEQDLASVANCYHTGKPANAWKLLSKESQAEEDNGEQFNANFSNDGRTTKSFRVLGIESRDGAVFGRVEVVSEVTAHGKKKCSDVSTYSWTQEGGSWRRVRLPRTSELGARLFQNGDYSGSASTSEKWLALDPFSLDAYKLLVFSQARRGGSRSPGARSTADTVRAALAVNPADSTGLFIAVSQTRDPDVAESLFERITLDDCQREIAAFNLANNLPPRRLLAFLDKIGSASPSMQMQAISAALKLGETYRLDTLLTVENDKQIRSELDAADGSYAAGWSVMMGNAWLARKNRLAARDWATYAASRDPSHSGVAPLLRRTRT